MTTSKILYLIALLLILIAAIQRDNEPKYTPAQVPQKAHQLTHQQETWVSALEWCESRGNPTAVNPKDRDGTPSYYSFQFKPETFLSFGKLYGIIPKDTTLDNVKDTLIKDTKMQRSIVERMVLDQSVELIGQFPECVRKLGLPSRTSYRTS